MPGEGGVPSSAARPSNAGSREGPISPIDTARERAAEVDTNGTTRMDIDRGAGIVGESV